MMDQQSYGNIIITSYSRIVVAEIPGIKNVILRKDPISCVSGNQPVAGMIREWGPEGMQSTEAISTSDYLIFGA